MSEDSGTRAISRIVMLAEALFEVVFLKSLACSSPMSQIMFFGLFRVNILHNVHFHHLLICEGEF